MRLMAEPLDLARSIIDALLDRKIALTRLTETEDLVQQWIGDDRTLAEETLLEACGVAAAAVLRLAHLEAAADNGGEAVADGPPVQPYVDRVLNRIVSERSDPK